MSLNFNVSPYYDDFDPSKNFHRILFKPGAAVQARELTQSQTILQDQISKFADNIFTQNTPVSGGKVTTNLYCYYIRLNTQYNNVTVTASAFLNKTITNADGTVLAKVIATAEATGSGAVAGDPPTLIVTYLSGPQFTDNMVVTPTDGTNIGATVSTSTTLNPSTGYSSVASISDGVFYVVNGYSKSSTQNADGSFTTYSIGNFVAVQPQTVILNKYTNKPSYRIGLSIAETITDYVADASLLDPAVGASNYQAPGADRYTITLTLTTLPLTLGNDDQFIELVRIQNGSVVKQVDGTVYSTIDDYFAKRDYETNGDYIVEDFKLTPAPNAGGNSAKYDLSVGPGVAYVHGYRVENQANQLLTSDRAQSTANISTNSVYVDYGNYFIVDTVGGTSSTGFDPTSMPQVDFHCVPASSINTANTTTYNSTKVGSGFLRNLDFVSSTTNANTKSYVFNAYVSDINTTTLSGTALSGTTNTIIINDPTDVFSTSANAYFNATLKVTGGTSIGDIRNIISYTVAGGVKTITTDLSFTVIPDATTQFSILFQSYDVESIVKPSGSSYTANANISLTGKVNNLVTGDTILNVPGSPEMLFTVGYPYVSSITNSDYYSTKIFRSQTFSGSGLSLSITSGPLKFIGNGALSNNAIQQNFTVIDNATGNVLDMTATTVTVTGGTTVNFATTAYSGKTVNVIAKVFVSNGDNLTDSGQVLKIKNLVVGDAGNVSSSLTNVSGTNVSLDLTKGQAYITAAGISSSRLSLYVSDVKKIKKIVDTQNPSVAPSAISGILSSSQYDITTSFKFDNGQRDNYYDHAGITLIPGAPLPTGNILIIYDYYSHSSSGDGYFSVMSYLSPKSSAPESYSQIPIYTSSAGTVYKLSDSIDFRPTRTNAQTSYVWDYHSGDANEGVLIPTNLTNFISNYYYYLGRKDKLVLTKDKQFSIIEGTPAVTPVLPVEPNGSLVIANLTLDPYTAFVPGEGQPGIPSNLSINKVIHKRWVKSDITDLETRVNNMEYYTSLNLLEQNAQSLQVPDQNGLNRFKNGILVDDFSSFAAADTQNADYGANINIRNGRLGPISIVDNFQLQNPVVLNSLGTLPATSSYAINSINGTQTNIYTLPYTTANTIVQALASSTVSVNPFQVTIVQGVEQLNPPMDNWVDNVQAPSLLITDPNMQIYQQTAGVNLTNAGDFQTIPGTTTTVSGPSQSFANHGTLSNSPFGSTVGYTATTTQTYGSQLQNITTTSGLSQVSSTFGTNNGYLTNIAVLPYIRPQQIIVKSKGLLVNTPVSTWFDGQSVDQYITSPNTIELSGVSGKFNEDDVVGFYVANIGQFYPVARVVSVYNYPNGNIRLYVAKIVNPPTTVATTTLRNATFDSNGNYVSSTASGTISSSAINSVHQSGQIAGVGGAYTPISANTGIGQLYFSQTNQAFCSFLNQYGVWGDTTYAAPFSANLPVYFATTGTYTFTSACQGSATITLDTTTVLSSVSSYSSTVSQTQSITAGYHYVKWSATGGPAFALTIRDPNGNNVFDTAAPPNLSYGNSSSEIIMPGGGAWFTGVTAIKLEASASSVTNYYAGSVINITSNYVYNHTYAATYVPPPPAPSGGGGGGKIICQKLSELGYFDTQMNEADQRFGLELQKNDRDAYAGYLRWARTVVDLMEGKGSEGLRKVVFFWERDAEKRIEMQKNITTTYINVLAKPWAEEMAFRMGAKGYEKSNFAGKLVMNIGLPLCRTIGRWQSNTKMAMPVKILSIWGVTTVLLVTITTISSTNAVVNKIKGWFKDTFQSKTINS